jgi:L-2-hydroxyglutarate oxidase
MYDYLVIGGGIIGLSIARQLKLKHIHSKILLIEKEPDVAYHASGRNSGVIHAGFYYTADSLKAKFTKQGNTLLKDFCNEKNLKINESGKVIVAQDEKELEGLKELKRRADLNNVNLVWMNEDELQDKYPYIKTYKKALFSPSTATINPKDVCLAFKDDIKSLEVEMLFNCTYEKNLGENNIQTSKGKFQAKKVINAAGLYADKIAKNFGFCKDYVIIPFKGIYLKDTLNTIKLDTNIYPVPNLNNPFLGVHYTLSVNNEAKIGPTAIPAFWRENYKGFKNFKLDEFIQILYYEIKLFYFNSFNFRRLALTEIKKYNSNYLKNLAMNFLYNKKLEEFNTWSTPGIRAQLLNIKTLELLQDFVVQSDENSIHILNAVSPAFTSSMAFAKWIVHEHIDK